MSVVKLPSNQERFETAYCERYGRPKLTIKGIEEYLIAFTPADWVRIVESSNVGRGSVRVEFWAKEGGLNFDRLLHVANETMVAGVTASVAPPSRLKRAHLRATFATVDALEKISNWLMERLGGSWV